MAPDIVVRAAVADPSVEATVAVSMFSRAVTAEAPRNLPIIVGGWEGFLADEALEAEQWRADRRRRIGKEGRMVSANAAAGPDESAIAREALAAIAEGRQIRPFAARERPLTLTEASRVLAEMRRRRLRRRALADA